MSFTGCGPIVTKCDRIVSEERRRNLQLPESSAPDDIGALVRIEGGIFMMGAPDRDKNKPWTPTGYPFRRARPVHKETLRPFYIGKYEVTAREFCGFLKEANIHCEEAVAYVKLGPASTIVLENEVFRPRSGYDLAPAVPITWDAARRYCAWLSGNTGDVYRLPTEIEWEFVASLDGLAQSFMGHIAGGVDYTCYLN